MRICVIMNTILPGDIWMAVLAFAMTRSQRIRILSMALYRISKILSHHDIHFYHYAKIQLKSEDILTSTNGVTVFLPRVMSIFIVWECS